MAATKRRGTKLENGHDRWLGVEVISLLKEYLTNRLKGAFLLRRGYDSTVLES